MAVEPTPPSTKPKCGRPRQTYSLLDVQRTSQPNNMGNNQAEIEAILNTSSVFDPGLLSKGFKHEDFKLPNHTWEPPQNPPEALVAMQMVNDIDLANVKIKPVRPRNLSRQKLTAMQELANNKDIVIKPADKGTYIVIQDLDDYIAKGERQLKDTNFYVPLAENPTKVIMRRSRTLYQICSKMGKSTVKQQNIWGTPHPEPHNCIAYQKYIKANCHPLEDQLCRQMNHQQKEFHN